MGWRHFILPPELRAGLEAAVKMQSITRLNKHFEALEELGEEGRRLATHLRNLSRQYDMAAIKRALEEIGEP